MQLFHGRPAASLRLFRSVRQTRQSQQHRLVERERERERPVVDWTGPDRCTTRSKKKKNTPRQGEALSIYCNGDRLHRLTDLFARRSIPKRYNNETKRNKIK
mmetsp:Transcript_3194/g.7695  ORF Transcript_3194/g.7695 Transcript_3194/m.7695 type:complete len:102 (-) Transcript_3194:1298-1603(-)